MIQPLIDYHGDAPEVLLRALQYGYVISTPTCLALLRPVRSDWSDDVIVDPANSDEDGDCWFVDFACGDWRKIIGMAPRRRKWVAWQRRGFPRVRRHLFTKWEANQTPAERNENPD